MTYGKYKYLLIKNDYSPLPIYPQNKRPGVSHWTSDDYVPPIGYDHYGVGVRCGRGEFPIAGIDCDVLDPGIAKKITDFILETCGETVYRIGKSPKVMLVYRASRPGIRKKSSKHYSIGHIEFWGFGQQFVAFGIHPDTKKPYTWPGILGDIADVKASDLTILSEEKMQSIIDFFENLMESLGHKPLAKEEKPKVTTDFDFDDPLDQKEPLGLSADKIKETLTHLDPDCNRDQWRNIGMALHHEFQGADEGLQIWDEWSTGGAKYKRGEPAKQWESFGKYRGRPITGAFLLKLAKKEDDIWKDPDFFKKLEWSTDRFLDDPPAIPMVINEFMPRGIVSLFYSAGGAGKSTLVLYMAVRIALAKSYSVDFLRHVIPGGKVVIITAEDPELILNRRFIATVKSIAEELQEDLSTIREAISENLFIVSTFGKHIHLFKLGNDKYTLETTEYFDSLKQSLLEVSNLHLVVIDTKTRFSPGEGLGNVTATQEITYYESLANETGASVMLLHHSNKVSRDGSQTGAQAYRDATALFDSVRAAWYLRGLTDVELNANGFTAPVPGSYLLLENSKNNYIQVNPEIILHRQGYTYEITQLAPKVSATERKEIKAATAYDKVLNLMQSSRSKDFTQATLLRQAKEIEDLGRRVVINAITDLLDDNLIVKNSIRRYQLTEEGRNYGLDAF